MTRALRPFHSRASLRPSMHFFALAMQRNIEGRDELWQAVLGLDCRAGAGKSRFRDGSSLQGQCLKRRAIGCPATRPALENRCATGVHPLLRFDCSSCTHRMHIAAARDAHLDAMAQEEKGLVCAVL